jgi:hypothetical protein
VSVPVYAIYKEELSHIYVKGYDIVTYILKCGNVKTGLCQERRNDLGAAQNPEDGSKICIFGRSFTSGKELHLSLNRSH